MIITNSIAKSNLDNYVDKNGKISRDIKNKKLFKIVTGLYETDENTPAYLLAGSIYGPSYISFEYALSYYGMIPERVTTITCATFAKKKKKQFFKVTTYGVSQRQKKAIVNAIMQKKRLIVYSADFC